MEETAARGTDRRSARDWVVDSGLFGFAVLFGLLTAGERAQSSAVVADWLLLLDQITAVTGCLALWLRRRWPVPLALTLVLVSIYSELVAGALVVALFTVAAHRPPRTSLAVLGLSIVTAVCFVLLRPEPSAFDTLLLLVVGVTAQGAAVG